jgi:hypothetical protein
MSEIEGLTRRIQDTNEAIARLERSMVDRPELPSLLTNMSSLRKLYANLEAEFRQAADSLGVDVCRYRLFVDGEEPTLPGIASALNDFQTMFSLVYAAITDGPKATGHLGAEAAKDTTFGFSYSFSGSTGVVLTLPNQRLLFDEVSTALDKAMAEVFTMAKASTPDHVRDFARRLGAAPVRALYRWANDHVRSRLGAEIAWQRSERVRASVFVQQPELERLRDAIVVTSDKVVTTLVTAGELVGADIPARTFHLKVGNLDMKGRFVDAISEQHSVTLPKPYKATVQVTTQINYSTEREYADYVLLRLEELETDMN